MSSSSEIRVTFSGGRVRAIYNDALVPLLAEGEFTVTRASHVEPFGDGWIADMSPSGGPVLWDESRPKVRGHRLPFTTRQAALDAEINWLRQNRGL